MLTGECASDSALRGVFKREHVTAAKKCVLRGLVAAGTPQCVAIREHTRVRESSFTAGRCARAIA